MSYLYIPSNISLFRQNITLYTKKPHAKRMRFMLQIWWAMTGSNCRHPACKAGALPAELIAHIW